jgi:signal transduction histidine kinase
MLKKALSLLMLSLSVIYAGAVEIDSNITTFNAVSAMKACKDNGAGLTIEDFLPQKTLLCAQSSASAAAGVNSGVLWFYIDIKNISQKQMSWVLSTPKVNATGMVYFIKENGVIEMMDVVNLYVFLNHPGIAFKGKCEAGETGRVVFRFSLEDGGFVYPQFDISSEEAFLKNSFKSTMFKSVTFGAVLVLFFYNFFLFLSLKSRALAWYCIYMSCVVVFILSNSGIGYEFIWRRFAGSSKYIFTTAYPLMFASALQFSRVFLRTKERFATLDKVLKASIALFLALMLYAFVGYRENAGRVFSISSFIMALLPFLGMYVWRAGYKEARFYTFAWSVWAVGMIPLMLLLLGFEIRYESVAMSTRVALVFESLLLSFALSDQINILRAERNEAIARFESQKETLEIQSRLAQMGEMIAAIGHQWKQPLNLMTLYIQEVQYMATKCGDKANDMQSELERLRDIVLGMSSTLDDFKNFFSPSKIKKLFSPLTSINNVLGMVGKQYEHENISITVEGDETIKVFGRENELKQALVNIFNNAKDVFVERGIEQRQIKALVSKKESQVCIEISDNAGGIPDEVIGRIFEQYYTTKGDIGTGIGLYICKKIIENSFGGSLRVQNSDVGAKFEIFLPVVTDLAPS